MRQDITRRELLAGAGVGVGALLARPAWSRAVTAPTGKVTVAKCKTYGTELAPTLDKMFDQLGGLGGLVKGKTVAVKVNFIGVRWSRLGNALMEDTYWTHPRIIGATVSLLGKAGARRIRVLEGPWSTPESLEEVMVSMNWKPQDILNAADNVEFENTNFLGKGKKYSRFMVPGGGLMFPGYDLNHSYEDCDVFVSLAKLKEHTTAGITLSMKNCFGITPCTIYGEGAPEDEPGLFPRGGRGPFHAMNRLPPKSAPPPVNPNAFSPNGTEVQGGYSVPRVVADLVAARPVHLAIIDGIHTMTGGEGPWIEGRRHVQPGLLVAGTNCVATDAVAMALRGFDPMA